MAIICRCLPFNFIARPEFAVASAAARWSYSLGLDTWPGFATWAFGSRLKLSTKRVVQFPLGSVAPEAKSFLSELFPPEEGMCTFFSMSEGAEEDMMMALL